jgi:hypothetical protein
LKCLMPVSGMGRLTAAVSVARSVFLGANRIPGPHQQAAGTSKIQALCIQAGLVPPLAVRKPPCSWIST